MLFLSLVFPLAEITFLTPPKAADAPAVAVSPQDSLWLPLLLLGAILVVVFLGLAVRAARRPAAAGRRRRSAAPATPGKAPRWILVDGSNVMHWKDNRPDWLPLRQVVGQLGGRGFTPGVVFDANAGYKLTGAYMNDRALARALGMPVARVLVAPKGTPADSYILETARDLRAPVVSNDRYRDWAASYPEVAATGFLVRGGFREGEVWMEETGEADAPGSAVTADPGAQ